LIERLIKHAFNFAFDARHTYSHRHIDRFVCPLILGRSKPKGKRGQTHFSGTGEPRSAVIAFRKLRVVQQNRAGGYPLHSGNRRGGG
jgi:hypothetical protein